MKLFRFIGFIMLVLLTGNSTYAAMGAWDRHCAACHDGQTVLNNRVLPDKKQLKAKYNNLQEFMNACGATPACMNIVKHDNRLLKKAGKELGIRDTIKK